MGSFANRLAIGPVFATLSLSFPSVASADFKATCLGSPDAARQVIYLRGITPDAGPAEGWRLSRFRGFDHTVLSTDLFFEAAFYERDWDVLAKELGLQVALVESDRYCTGSLSARCWTGDETGSIASTFAEVVKAAGRCFKVTDGHYGLVGFSNGGYHVDRVVMQCLKPTPRWAVAVGSAGDAKLAGEDLSHCTKRLTLAIGDHDITNAKARLFAGEMQRRKLDARFVEFYGGHELPRDALREILREQP